MKKTPIFRKKNIKKEVKRKRFAYALYVFLGLFLIIGSFLGLRYTVLRWNLFALKRIEILGNPQSMDAQDIIKLSKVKLGENLFSLNLQKIHQNLEAPDFFKRVLVHRRLPNSLVIEVKEYHPEFILHTGRMYYVDEFGEIFKDVTETEDKKDFPVLSGVDEDMILENPMKVREVIKHAVALKQIYLRSEFAAQYGLSEVNFDKNIGFNLYPEKQKYSIKFGNSEFEAKMEKLSQFWQHFDKSKVNLSAIDLNYPGKVLMTL